MIKPMNIEQPTGFERIYEALRQKKSDEGMAYVLLASNRLIELMIMANTIVFMRSRGITIDEAVQMLAAGQVSAVNLEPFKVGIEVASPDTVHKTFPFIAPFVLGHDRSEPSALLLMLRLMQRFASQPQDEASGRAFQTMMEEMKKAFPDMALARAEAQQRLAGFESENKLILPGINTESIPAEPAQIIDWAFNRIASNDSMMENSILFYLFWGRYIRPIYKMVIRKASKSSGSDVAAGTAGVFRQRGVDIKDKSSVLLFKGINRIGELRAQEIIPQRQLLGEAMIATSLGSRVAGPETGFDLYMHQQDMGHLGLREGEKIHAIIY
jgi:hypothetical protein